MADDRVFQYEDVKRALDVVLTLAEAVEAQGEEATIRRLEHLGFHPEGVTQAALDFAEMAGWPREGFTALLIGLCAGVDLQRG